ncbi:MAG TPA: ubiquinol oxidase subunit II [Steroidobacteraceae bacterium]|nr:ubiquinol oxidase subunit II [Steroidobacteraceae bacterium]
MATAAELNFTRPLHCLRPMLALAALALSGCDSWIERPAGPISSAERIIFLDTLAIMLLIVVPVIIAIIGFAWWFRASNERARHLPHWSFSGRIELVIWSIPALVVLFLGGIAWISAHDLDPGRSLASKRAPLEIDVVALDWKWLFIYPQQGVASVNRLVVPAGVPLRFRLTSATVWNAFWIPKLGSMLYCMYGMAGTLYLQADRPGVYHGLSAMISGDGFATMHFDTQALSDAQFQAWSVSARAAGPALDEPAYRALLKPSSEVSPYSYRSVMPHLFDAIVLQRLPPGPGGASKP